MRTFPAAALAVGLAIGLALSVRASPDVNCGDWARLTAAEREATVQTMIDQTVASNRARKYEINREAIRRCLRENSYQIETSFDDICANPRTADMRAIRTVFKNYVWSCAG